MTKGQPLSRREVEIKILVAKGFSNKKIADLLFVCEKTIKWHMTNILRKCEVKSRAQLIVQALMEKEVEAKVLTAPEPPPISLAPKPASFIPALIKGHG